MTDQWGGHAWSTPIVGVFYDRPPRTVGDITDLLDLADSEIQKAVDRGEFQKCPIKDNHDRDGHGPIGIIERVYRRQLQWLVQFRLRMSHPRAALVFADIKRGQYRGLSLSHDLLSRKPYEISVCPLGARPGCVIVEASHDQVAADATRRARALTQALSIRMNGIPSLPVVPVQASQPAVMSGREQKTGRGGPQETPLQVEFTEEQMARAMQIWTMLGKTATGGTPPVIPEIPADGGMAKFHEQVASQKLAEYQQYKAQLEQQQQMQEMQRMHQLMTTNPALLAQWQTQQSQQQQPPPPQQQPPDTRAGDFAQHAAANLQQQYQQLQQGQVPPGGPNVLNTASMPTLAPNQSAPTPNSVMTFHGAGVQPPPPAAAALPLPSAQAPAADEPMTADQRQLKKMLSDLSDQRFETLWAEYRKALSSTNSSLRGDKLEAQKVQARKIFDGEGGADAFRDLLINPLKAHSRSRRGRNDEDDDSDDEEDHTGEVDEKGQPVSQRPPKNLAFLHSKKKKKKPAESSAGATPDTDMAVAAPAPAAAATNPDFQGAMNILAQMIAQQSSNPGTRLAATTHAQPPAPNMQVPVNASLSNVNPVLVEAARRIDAVQTEFNMPCSPGCMALLGQLATANPMGAHTGHIIRRDPARPLTSEGGGGLVYGPALRWVPNEDVHKELVNQSKLIAANPAFQNQFKGK